MNFGELFRGGLRKAKSLGGGGMAGYCDDGSHISPPVLTDTPFHRALDIVDRRDGYAWHIARMWKGATAVMTIAALVGYGGWAWQAHKSSVEWLVVPVDRFGEPGEISTPPVFEPTTAQLAERAQELVKAAFGKSSDWRVNQANYEFVKNTLYGQAIVSWRDWWRENENNQPDETVIRIVTVKPSASPRTLNIVWMEADYKAGEAVYPVRRMNGDFTLEYKKPIRRADAMKNKLGIYVTAMRFAPEAR